jgi:hypothetical protein
MIARHTLFVLSGRRGIGQRERCTTTLCFMNRSNRTPWVLDTCKPSLLKTL